jgi:hypothetical protein
VERRQHGAQLGEEGSSVGVSELVGDALEGRALGGVLGDEQRRGQLEDVLPGEREVAGTWTSHPWRSASKAGLATSALGFR